MPPTLVEQQRAMLADILGHVEGGETSGAGAHPLAPMIRLAHGVDVETRLDIHRHGYPARIAEALRESFPAIANILGGERFDAMARGYAAGIQREPHNLNDIGAALPPFLTGGKLAEDLPFLPDLARLELAVVQCFHAPQRAPFDASRCSEWSLDDWSSARLVFQPGTSLIRSPWPIRELRETRELERDEIDVDLVGKPDRVLVHRSGFDVVCASLDEAEAGIFERLHKGDPLGEVSLALAESGAEPELVSQLFARWIGAGLVRDCATGDEG